MNPPIKDWRGKRVWIIGASSGIGAALAKQLYALDALVFVSARNELLLQDFVATRPLSQAIALDVTQPESLSKAFLAFWEQEPIDLIIYCAGHYQPMRAQDFNLDEARKHFEINYFGALNLLKACLPQIIQLGSGHISFISSVAGYSGLTKSLA